MKATDFPKTTGLLGLEPSAPDLQVTQSQALTEGATVHRTKYGTKTSLETPIDQDLAAVVNTWPTLPETIRARILGLVEGATATGSGG